MRLMGGRLLSIVNWETVMSRLVVLGLLAGLTACTSLGSAFDGASGLLSPSSQESESAENAESGEAGGEAAANAAPAAGNAEAAPREAAAAPEAPSAAPTSAQAAAEPPAAAPPATEPTEQAQTAREPANAESGEQSGEAEGEGESGGENEAGLDGRRIVTVPKGSGANAEIRRRLDSLFGESRSSSSAVETGVKPSEIVGTWLLEEEDGLRNCTITLTAPDKGGAVSGGPDCTGLAAQVTGWGMFGNDLLLRDADNTVQARLRRSDAGWIGFTLETGIPLVMSRSG